MSFWWYVGGAIALAAIILVGARLFMRPTLSTSPLRPLLETVQQTLNEKSGEWKPRGKQKKGHYFLDAHGIVEIVHHCDTILDTVTITVKEQGTMTMQFVGGQLSSVTLDDESFGESHQECRLARVRGLKILNIIRSRLSLETREAPPEDPDVAEHKQKRKDEIEARKNRHKKRKAGVDEE
jgi:hypothetical protein